MTTGAWKSFSVGMLAFFLGIMGVTCLGVDTITLKDIVSKKQETHEGTFESFKNNKFYFTTTSGTKLHELRTSVASLALDPPSRVNIKALGAKKTDGLSLKGYDNSQFLFEDAGGAETKISGAQVTAIEMAFDMRRKVADHAAQMVGAGGEELNIENYVKTGHVTVVHFNSDDVVSSVRQGVFVDTMARDSKGKIALVKVNMSSLDSPGAKKYGIASIPQFWFYDQNGRLATKLVDRFTESDITAAAEAAQKIRPVEEK